MEKDILHTSHRFSGENCFEFLLTFHFLSPPPIIYWSLKLKGKISKDEDLTLLWSLLIGIIDLGTVSFFAFSMIYDNWEVWEDGTGPKLSKNVHWWGTYSRQWSNSKLKFFHAKDPNGPFPLKTVTRLSNTYT